MNLGSYMWTRQSRSQRFNFCIERLKDLLRNGRDRLAEDSAGLLSPPGSWHLRDKTL